MNLSKRRFCVATPLVPFVIALARVAIGEVHKKILVKGRELR